MTEESTATVVGLGYVGLPTACLLAKSGLRTFGYDISRERIDTVSTGSIPLEEPGLGTLLKEVLATQFFTPSRTLIPSRSYVICVPTPLKNGDLPDLDHVLDAASSIAPLLKGGELIVLESTSPIGTTFKLLETLLLQNPDVTFNTGATSDIFVAYCPERVLPGNALSEIQKNARVVGGLNEESGNRAAELIKRYCVGEIDITSAEVAEATKLAENTFRDVNIAFSNELAEICNIEGLDVGAVISLANKHPRVDILEPGIGVGGHCIPIDPLFLARKIEPKSSVIHTSRRVNRLRPSKLVDALAPVIEALAPTKIFLLGLTYKPNTSDFRESPSFEFIHLLSERFSANSLEAVDPWLSFRDISRKLPHGVAFSAEIVPPDSNQLAVILVAHAKFATLKGKDNVIWLPGASLVEVGKDEVF